MEIWKDVPGYEGKYQVSNIGNVRSLPNKTRSGTRLMKPSAFKTGYLYVNLRDGCGKLEKRSVHTLVMRAFVGKPPIGQDTRHLNNIRADNRLDNLEYGTKAENQADRVAAGTSNIGEGNPSCRLTKEDVLKIRESKLSSDELAVIYGVSPSTIRAARNGQTWKHLS